MPDELKYIRCPHCGTLFGIESPHGSLVVKFKDLYREIEGRVSGPCRKCGTHFSWPSESVLLVIDRRGP